MSHAEKLDPPAPDNLPEVPVPEPPAPAAPAPEIPARLQSGPLRGLIAAVAAWLIVWGILHANYPVFKLPPDLMDVPPSSPPELVERQTAALQAIEMKKAVFSLGLLGLTLGLFLAIAESQARRQWTWAPWTGMVAAVVAAVGGCAAGMVGSYVHQHFQKSHQYDPLAETIIVQAVMLGILGISVGLAVALPYRRLRLTISCVIGCLLGGLLAALIYPVGMATLFKLANTERLFPFESTTRLAWLGAAAILIALVATGMGKRRRTQEQEAG